MTVKEKVTSILDQVQDLYLGSNEINFVPADELEDAQRGYGLDGSGAPVKNRRRGDWNPDWLVIASDHLGDPIFVNITNRNLPVFIAEQGDREWELTPLASSIDSFASIIETLEKLSEGRSTGSELEENPIPESEFKETIEAIKSKNPGLDAWWWEIFLGKF